MKYCTNSASEVNIEEHLKECPDVLANLNNRVNVSEYSKKLCALAESFEAWEDEKLIGYLACYCNDKSSKSAFISNLSVLPQFRRQGVAKKLFSLLWNSSSLNDFKTIRLEVDSQNTSAIQLYSKEGFVIESRGEHHIMVKHI